MDPDNVGKGLPTYFVYMPATRNPQPATRNPLRLERLR
jgi:hypothetical protein